VPAGDREPIADLGPDQAAECRDAVGTPGDPVAGNEPRSIEALLAR
jgi:hypothetical protein